MAGISRLKEWDRKAWHEVYWASSHPRDWRDAQCGWRLEISNMLIRSNSIQSKLFHPFQHAVVVLNYRNSQNIHFFLSTMLAARTTSKRLGYRSINHVRNGYLFVCKNPGMPSDHVHQRCRLWPLFWEDRGGLWAAFSFFSNYQMLEHVDEEDPESGHGYRAMLYYTSESFLG